MGRGPPARPLDRHRRRAEPNVDPLGRIELEQLARVAELQVAHAPGSPRRSPAGRCTIVPVTRTHWVQRTLDAYRPLFERLATSLGSSRQRRRPPVHRRDPFEDRPATRSRPGSATLMQFHRADDAGDDGRLDGRPPGHPQLRPVRPPDPPPAGRRAAAGRADLDAFGEEWSLPADDLRLWVCLHEIAHHAVLGVPHVRRRLESPARSTSPASGPTPGRSRSAARPSSTRRPGRRWPSSSSCSPTPRCSSAPIQSAAQEQLLAPPRRAGRRDRRLRRPRDGPRSASRLVGSLRHGHRGGAAAPGRGRRRRPLRRAPVRPGAHPGRYDRGAAFVDGVVERAGEDGLARLWSAEPSLPTPAEVDAPGLWLARIDLARPTDPSPRPIDRLRPSRECRPIRRGRRARSGTAVVAGHQRQRVVGAGAAAWPSPGSAGAGRRRPRRRRGGGCGRR